MKKEQWHIWRKEIWTIRRSGHFRASEITTNGKDAVKYAMDRSSPGDEIIFHEEDGSIGRKITIRPENKNILHRITQRIQERHAEGKRWDKRM